MRDVALALWRKGLLVARATAKSHHNHLALALCCLTVEKRAAANQRGAQCHARRVAQKVAAAAAEQARNLRKWGGAREHDCTEGYSMGGSLRKPWSGA